MYNNAGLNKVILVGYITAEPKLTTPAGAKAQLIFSVTTHESIKTSSGSNDHTEIHLIRMETTNPTLRNIEIKLGKLVYVQGKLHTNSFFDELRIKRYTTEVIASSIEIFDRY